MKWNEDGRQKYGDIISLPHHVSVKHPHMARSDRAAQFAPFAALSGHREAVKETQALVEAERREFGQEDTERRGH